jgi:hypothetical protein
MTASTQLWSLMTGSGPRVIKIAPARVWAVFGDSTGCSQIARTGRLVGVRWHR